MLGRRKHRTPLERLKVYAQACGEAGRDPVLAVGGIDPFGDEHSSPHCLTCVCRPRFAGLALRPSAPGLRPQDCGVLDAARFGDETRRAAELGSVTEETPRIGLATDRRLRRGTRKGRL